MKVVARNRKASHDYHIIDSIEAGIVLTGTEVKSIREGRVNLKDSFALIKHGEVILKNMHISKYSKNTGYDLDPLRDRKLLLHRKEILKLARLVDEKGITLVPLKLYLKNGFVKIELGIVKGKKQYDKRKEIARRDIERELKRTIKGF